ncbi:hypothetical protein GYB22_10900 [bacterium]|nr:hypothetical protein [bacterium]
MKINYLFLIIGIIQLLLISSCKKDPGIRKSRDVKEHVITPWEQLGDSVIYYGNRDIMSAGISDGKIYFQTTFLHYMLDSNLNRLQVTLQGPRYFPSRYHYPIIGEEISIHSKASGAFFVYETESGGIGQRDVYLPYFLGYDDIYKSANSDQFLAYSNPTGRTISVVSAHDHDSVIKAYVRDFTFAKNAGIPLEYEQSEDILIREFRKLNFASTHYIMAYRHNETTFCNVSTVTYMIENNQVVDSALFDILQLTGFDNNLYAIAQNAVNYFHGTPSSGGFLISEDGGRSWNHILETNSLRFAKLATTDDYVVIYTSDQMWAYSFDMKALYEINTLGLNAQIRTVNEIGGKIVVGTDAGVYYKSADLFTE